MNLNFIRCPFCAPMQLKQLRAGVGAIGFGSTGGSEMYVYCSRCDCAGPPLDISDHADYEDGENPECQRDTCKQHLLDETWNKRAPVLQGVEHTVLCDLLDLASAVEVIRADNPLMEMHGVPTTWGRFGAIFDRISRRSRVEKPGDLPITGVQAVRNILRGVLGTGP